LKFFKIFFQALKQKNFVVYIALFLGYNVLRSCLLGSMQYGIRYLLKMPAKTSAIIMIGYLIASIIAIPLWVLLVQQKKMIEN